METLRIGPNSCSALGRLDRSGDRRVSQEASCSAEVSVQDFDNGLGVHAFGRSAKLIEGPPAKAAQSRRLNFSKRNCQWFEVTGSDDEKPLSGFVRLIPLRSSTRDISSTRSTLAVCRFTITPSLLSLKPAQPARYRPFSCVAPAVMSGRGPKRATSATISEQAVGGE
jgi:hypothetical protein